MYDQSSFYIERLICDTCVIWIVHKRRLFDAYSIFGNEILLLEKFNTLCFLSLFYDTYCKVIWSAGFNNICLMLIETILHTLKLSAWLLFIQIK